jgi:tetratricopeptide (TPR) repeat protein
MFKWLMLAYVIFAFTGCIPQVDYEYEAEEESALFKQVLGEEPAVQLDILAITPDIRSTLDREISRDWGSRLRLKKLRELLFSEDQLNIQYEAGNTRTASETFEARAGNCLSMTSLFIAAARYIGLEAKYQIVEVDPTWDHNGTTMIRYQHIVATGQVAGGGIYVIDFLPEFIIGDMHAYVISDLKASSLYFNNLGAEGIVDGRIDEAIFNLQQALKIRGEFSDAWNNMGAAMRRSGEYGLAEFSYLRAISQDYNNYSALSNLAQFYRFRHRPEEAATFLKRVERYRAQNPYYHYYQAKVAFQNGRYIEAESLLKSSIRLKRDEPDFYIALSKSYEKMGNTSESLAMLSLAEKYREGTLRAPERRMNHRYWSMVIDVNP